MTKKIGRPTLSGDGSPSSRVHLKLPTDEKNRWVTHFSKQGVKLSDGIRRVMNGYIDHPEAGELTWPDGENE